MSLKRQEAKATSSDAIEWSDIQGIIRRGFKNHKCSMFLVLKVANRQNAGRWLSGLSPSIVSGDMGEGKLPECVVNISFTAKGLRAMGLDNLEMLQFSEEFNDGMAPVPLPGQQTTRRSGMLGDIRHNNPDLWNWGGWITTQSAKTKKISIKGNADNVHILLNVYGQSIEVLEQKFKQLITTKSGVALSVNRKGKHPFQSKFFTYLRDDNCEQFGFRDGISQPIMRGTAKEKSLSENARKLHSVPPGEFLLGYDNDRDQSIFVPRVKMRQDGQPTDLKEGFEFGKNGSYLAVRQLEQRVEEFHNMLDICAKNLREFETPQEGKDWIAARIMGRQFNGEPVENDKEHFSTPPVPDGFITQPNIKNPEGHQHVGGPFPPLIPSKIDNDFGYVETDNDGLTCPLTSHVRRAFPRDALGKDPRISLKITNRHRILRRGRLYGHNPISGHKNEGPKAKSSGKKQCGLFFMGFNADLAGQFETVQHSWVNNRHFGGLYKETGPVTGQGDADTRFHTIQQRPVNIRLGEIEDFIIVRGGEYFFMPGKKALSVLAMIAESRS